MRVLIMKQVLVKHRYFLLKEINHRIATDPDGEETSTKKTK